MVYTFIKTDITAAVCTIWTL